MAELQPADMGIVGDLRPPVLPRSRWAGGLDPVGPLNAEEDVRFILVHHTASRNDYRRDETAEEIRGFYRLHIGPRRGWSDVAYNFLIDRFGRIWEGRAGSLERAVRGDATGGSQGYAQLCALIGDHRTESVSEAATIALIHLVAWLGERHDIDTAPGREVVFVSRGSNRWPTGAKVTASTIAGHRDMSITSCPGDAVYDLITGRLPAAATELRQATRNQLGVDADDPSSAGPVPNHPVDAGTEEPGGVDRAPNPGQLRSVSMGSGAEATQNAGPPGNSPALVGLGVGGTAAVATLGALLALRRRRSV